MDRLDIDMYDDELQTEIQLVADLMIAANQANGRIGQTDAEHRPSIERMLSLRASPCAPVFE